MTTDFRSAAGQRLEWFDASEENGFSNFLHVDKNYFSEPVVRRIFSLARKLKYNSLLVEEITHPNCDLHAEEDAALKKRRPDFDKSIVHRLVFLSCRPGEKPTDAQFIAYAVIKLDYFSSKARPDLHVYESVMVPPRSVNQNNFVHCRKTYRVNTLAGPLSISGVLYAQQNNNTYVCSHVALRTALASLLDEGDITYGRINALAGVDHEKRQVGQDKPGLFSEEIEKVLQQLSIDYEKIVYDPKQKIDIPTEYQRNIYGFIESGQPVLLGFELNDPSGTGDSGGRHIIPVFGHTFNEDTWVADAQQLYFGETLKYYPSENWLSAYVIHDDNVGPYFCLPRHFLRKENFRLILGLKKSKTAFSALDVDAIASEYLRALARSNPKTDVPWYNRFAVFARQGLLVLRTVLVRRDQYIAHLKASKDRDGNTLELELITKFENGLPNQFWLTEASAQELFSATRRKFGEILIAADKPAPNPLDPSLIVGIRLPGQAVIDIGGSLDFADTKLVGHTGLFSF